ncbi:MAG: DUF3604 domain-containing protein, partial [Marivita sp.]|uniref:DUF3604 domain-containing protein n=1 Tax=Marivita sp. TaxID=2003365 RepID=UPI003EF35011
GNSFDAYIFNVRSKPEDVYKFALGETVTHPSGFEIEIDGPPLDFVAATDHGAYMGILPEMNTPGTDLNKLDMAQEMFSDDPELIAAAFDRVGMSVRSGEPLPGALDLDIVSRTWRSAVDAANEYYDPGTLTTFAAYEYTAVVSRGDEDGFGGGNLHRNVVFEGSAPDMPFSTLDSVNPEDLWDWMDTQREAGHEVLAIPHNSNVSDGKMFDSVTYDGSPLTDAYAQQRIRNEPIVEMTQVKGTSETHPALSPNDELANFEIYELLLGSTIRSQITGGFVREALANGLAIERDVGTNPYQFGMIGASDTHVAGGSFTEENYWSKVGIVDGTPERRGSIPPGGARTWEGIDRVPNAENWFSKWGASGLAGVWAEENTRESIFAAMARRETFATTGPRMKVRMFAGDYEDSILGSADLLSLAYAGGVPMGGNLPARSEAPDILVWAMRDPASVPLAKVQIVKVWHDGEAQERIWDVACSDGNAPDAETRRCADNGASVDVSTCEASTGQGAPELKAVWRDPEFDAEQSAAYYVRVIENPTCRWSTWDAIRNGTPPHPDLPQTIRERAYTSPIWYDAG